MEIRINLLLLAVLGFVWLGLRASAPERIESVADAAPLAALEDAFAKDRGSADKAERLADAYLALGYGELAVVALRSAHGDVLERPTTALRLARAYERTGRLLDALATADLALARCGRVLGTRSAQTPTPSYGCHGGTYAALDAQTSALERMVRWGVVDPRTDPRALTAYRQAQRRARLAIGGVLGDPSRN